MSIHIKGCECRTDVRCDAYNEDTDDGAALRRLREAANEEWASDVQLDVVFDKDGGPVFIAIWPTNDASDGAEAEGATIAEAADKCREALK